MPLLTKTLSAQLLLCIFVVELVLCAQSSSVKPVDKVYLGFLDDAREEMANFKPGVASHRVIRPAFERTSSGWRQADPSAMPNRMQWTIAFDGKNLGQLESQANPKGGLTPFQTILTSAATVPNVGSPSEQLAGLLANPTKVCRPLIAVSKAYFQDPDGWKRAKLPGDIGTLVRKAFRHEYPHVYRRKEEKIVQRNWNFPDSALGFPIA
jgi:hypothetical protein